MSLVLRFGPLAEAGLKHGANQCLTDVAARYIGIGEAGAGGCGKQLRRRNGAERTLKSTDWSAACGNNNDGTKGQERTPKVS
jgi:hypothetical protein